MLHLTEPEEFKPIFDVVSCFCEYSGKVLLLLRQDNVRQPNTWGMVAGKVDGGETNKQAIKRELFEEAGIDLPEKSFKFFKKTYIKFPDYDYVYYIFKVNLNQQKEIRINPNEHKEYKWLTPNEALLLENPMEDLDNCIKLVYMSVS